MPAQAFRTYFYYSGGLFLRCQLATIDGNSRSVGPISGTSSDPFTALDANTSRGLQALFCRDLARGWIDADRNCRGSRRKDVFTALRLLPAMSCLGHNVPCS
jgi:hypothetical protein